MDPFAELARQVPGGGDPVEAWTSIERRSGAVRRRRRLVAGGGLVVLLVVAIASLVALTGDDDASVDVVTTTPPTTSAPPQTSEVVPATTEAPPPTTAPAPTIDAACQDGLALAEGAPTEVDAVAVVTEFLAARQAAADSPSGLDATEPFACVDVAMLEGYGLARFFEVLDVQPFGSTGTEQIVTALLETPDGLAREELRVAAVDGQAVIVDIRSAEVSSVGEADARALITTFLDALAAAEWELAADLLVNEGASEEVLTRIPDVLERGGEAVEAWCATNGRCDEGYEIGEVVEIEPFALGLTVAFGADGLPPTTMRVMSFEGQLSVGSLPPTR